MSGIGGKAAASMSACIVHMLWGVHVVRMHVMACMLQLAWHGHGACKRGQNFNQTSTAFDRPQHESCQGFRLSRILIKRAEGCTNAVLQVQHLGRPCT